MSYSESFGTYITHFIYIMDPRNIHVTKYILYMIQYNSYPYEMRTMMDTCVQKDYSISVEIHSYDCILRGVQIAFVRNNL